MGYMIVGVVLLFIIGFSGLFAYNILTELNDDIQSDDTFDNTSKQLSADFTEDYPSIMDGGFMMVFVILWVAILVCAYYFEEHPVFMFVGVLVLVVLIGVAGSLSNTYEEFATDSDFNTFSINFPMTDFIINHYLLVAVCVIISAAIVMYRGLA